MNIQEITEIVEDSVSELYSLHGIKKSDRPDAIEGYCHENALKVAENLFDNGYQPIFIWGTIASTCDTYSIEQAERNGSVHHWIEIPKNDITQYDTERDIKPEDTIVIDPYTLGLYGVGEVYVDTVLPEDYVRLNGGFIEYTHSLTKRDVISINKYEQIPDKMFVFEKETF